MISVTDDIALDEKEIRLEFVRSSGPGGQNVNKVSTTAQLRFDVLHSPSLPDDVRIRLVRLAGRRLSDDGVLLLRGRRYRTQERNRQDVIDRLVKLIRRAAQKPKRRRPTKPTRSSREQRLEDKRRRGQIKKWRRESGDD